MKQIKTRLMRYYIFTLILGALTLCAHAQTMAKGNVFSVVTWSDLGIEDLTTKSGEEFISIEFNLGKRSELYSSDSSGVFALYTKEEGSDGKIVPKLVGKTTYAKGSKRMLFMVFKASQDAELPLIIQGVDDSVTAFPAGSFRFANYTNKTLQVKMGKITKPLRPKEIKVYKVKGAPKGGLMTMIVADHKGKPIFGRRLFGQPANRSMVFITPPIKDKGPLKIKMLPEIVVPDKK